jgi:hypothetical protein
MPVMKDSLLQNIENITYSDQATIGNIVEGGQLGLGDHMVNIDAATPLVFPTAIVVPTHVPTMFDDIPYASDILVSLITRHAKSITNIDPNEDLESLESYTLPNGLPVSVPGRAKRSAISPSMTFPEFIGNNPVRNFFRFWRNMMSHPDTGYSNISNMIGSDEVPYMQFSTFSMDMIVILPDITLLPDRIIEAVSFTCMFPHGSLGEIGIKREIGGSFEVKERSVEFFSLYQNNKNTVAAGKAIMELLNLHRANYDYATPIADTIADKIKDKGLAKEIEDITSEFTPM